GPGVNCWIAAIIFVAAAITDTLDGHLARKYDAVTNIGKFLDPIADKLLVVSVLIWIVGTAGHRLITLCAILLVAREFIISGFRLVAATTGNTVIAAGAMGKIKTLSQYVAMTAYMFIGTSLIALAQAVFWSAYLISVALSIWSCADYIRQNWSIVSGKKPQKDDVIYLDPPENDAPKYDGDDAYVAQYTEETAGHHRAETAEGEMYEQYVVQLDEDDDPPISFTDELMSAIDMNLLKHELEASGDIEGTLEHAAALQDKSIFDKPEDKSDES
ncbi:MAG: CDP-diacylglycerol--glycerol-3-phosphate 3-phosphatidyltransferase, partial [Christensenellales bacterium]